MLNNPGKETEGFERQEKIAVERYYEAIREINTFYQVDLITDDTLRKLNEREIVELIANTEFPDLSDESEPADIANESTFLDASIELCERKIDRIKAESIDNSFATRHIFVVVKTLIVAGLTAFTGMLAFSLILGAIAYYYFANKEINYQKRSIHSRRISEVAMSSLVNKLMTLEKLKENL